MLFTLFREVVHAEIRNRTVHHVLPEVGLPTETGVHGHPAGRSPGILHVHAEAPLVHWQGPGTTVLHAGDASHEEFGHSGAEQRATEIPVAPRAGVRQIVELPVRQIPADANLVIAAYQRQVVAHLGGVGAEDAFGGRTRSHGESADDRQHHLIGAVAVRRSTPAREGRKTEGCHDGLTSGCR